MSNAAKYRKKAAEFEQLKQIDRAIASYVKAIEESESAGEDVDVALYNKVGDLALRQGRVPDAITYYERAVEHYATSGLFNNAIALCNKILRNAPGRANVYFTLGRISARKGLRGDATRNFLEYATRMQQDGRIEEGIRALAEVLDLMPELNDVRTMVDDLAARSGIALPRRKTPLRSDRQPTPASNTVVRDQKSQDLVFLDVDYGEASRRTPPPPPRIPTPASVNAVPTTTTVTPLSAALIVPMDGVDPSIAANAPAAETPPVDVSPPAAAELPVAVEVLVDALVDDAAPLDLDREQAIAPAVDLIIDALPEFDALLPAISEPFVDRAAPTPMVNLAVSALEGLEANGEFVEDTATPVLEGFAPDEVLSPAQDVDASVHPTDVTWLLPPDNAVGIPHLDDAVMEDYDDAANDQGVVRAIYTETPAYVPAIVPDAEIDLHDLTIERLDVESVPELDAAIAAGHALVEQAADAERTKAFRTPPMVLTPIVPMPESVPEPESAPVPTTDPVSEVAEAPVSEVAEAPVFEAPVADTAVLDVPEMDEPVVVGMAADEPPVALLAQIDEVEEQLEPYRPPFRLDPHDFILPGELPPLLLDDAIVDTGLAGAATAPAMDSGATATARLTVERATPRDGGAVPSAREEDVGGEPPQTADAPALVVSALAGATAEDAVRPSAVDTPDDLDDDQDEEVFDPDVTDVVPRRPVSVTPALPIAAVAEAATSVASSRRDALRAAVARLPQNWLLRRRLAEALFEAGERDAALAELETAQTGLVNDGEYVAASDIADELVHVSPDRVSYHQKRVELAVRSNDQQRLRLAYLDLADALVRMAEEGRARAVYARVLEIDPYDDRAREALGPAAPPPPPAARPDDSFVDLADWLRDDDKPVDTRMRMKEPAISGDEQADFDSLLRHFKEGVSRSLGEDDFESHYDLGVAYKEMGLLDDAIAEFQKALRSRAHRLPAYEALGQCFVEQGRFQVAATVLSRALHEPGLDDDQRVGVLYLLAYSCEALQRRDEARSYFQRVYATDINFRDVAARLAALEQVSR